MLSPANFYGDSKLQAEIKLNKLVDKSFKVAIMRPPMIYGEGCKGNYPVLKKIALISPIFPKVENRRSMIYIQNFAEFIRRTIDNQSSGIFNPSNKETIATYEIVKEIADANHKRIIMVSGFTWALKILSYITPFVNKAFGNMVYGDDIINKQDDYFNYSTRESIKKIEARK